MSVLGVWSGGSGSCLGLVLAAAGEEEAAAAGRAEAAALVFLFPVSECVSCTEDSQE